MRRIFTLAIAGLICAAPFARGQAVVSTQEMTENYRKLMGKVADLQDAQDAYRKQMESMGKEIAALREQVANSKPTGNYASVEDVKRLADAIDVMDKKREADKEVIKKELERIQKAVTSQPTRSSSGSGTGSSTHTSTPPADPTGDPATKTAVNPTDPYLNYTIKSGDTFSTIAAAYREQGVKVTSDQIEKANPTVKATSLKVGQKIIIPVTKTASN